MTSDINSFYLEEMKILIAMSLLRFWNKSVGREANNTRKVRLEWGTCKVGIFGKEEGKKQKVAINLSELLESNFVKVQFELC